MLSLRLTALVRLWFCYSPEQPGDTPQQRRSDVIFVLDSIEKADLLEEAATAISTNCTLWVCASFDCVAWLSVDCSALDPR